MRICVRARRRTQAASSCGSTTSLVSLSQKHINGNNVSGSNNRETWVLIKYQKGQEVPCRENKTLELQVVDKYEFGLEPAKTAKSKHTQM